MAAALVLGTSAFGRVGSTPSIPTWQARIVSSVGEHRVYTASVGSSILSRSTGAYSNGREDRFKTCKVWVQIPPHLQGVS